MAKQNKVAVNLAQDFTDTEKAQARANIGAGTSNTTIVHDSNTLPPVITNVNQMTIFNDGRTKFDTNYNGVIPTEPGQSDAGSVLVANYAGSPAKGTGVWTNIHEVGIREVPGATSSDAGKALILDANGNPIWSDAHYVSYDANQGLTSTQQKNARLNIAAVSQSQISDLHDMLYIRSLSNSFWVENPITWAANSGRHTWKGVAKWRLQPNDTLFCMLSGQLTESMDGSTEWAVSLNTSDAYPSSEAFSHYFSTNGRSSAASTWTNLPGTMLSYSNGSSEQEVTLGVYNSSSALTNGSAAALYGKVYGTSGDGRMLSGPCVWYCIFNERNRGYQET